MMIKSIIVKLDGKRFAMVSARGLKLQALLPVIFSS